MAKGGGAYEQHVHAYIEAEVQKGNLAIDPTTSKVFLHRKYHSKDRDSDIDFDVVIEAYRSGAKDPFLIWLFECKDSGRVVPVDDVEEFHSKLQQVGAHKGTVVAPRGFAKGVIAFAKSKRIGLMRFLPPGTAHLLLEHEAVPTIEEELEGLPDKNTLSDLSAMSANGEMTRSLQKLFALEEIAT